MNTVLDLICGLGWSGAYVAAVILGIRHQVYCIPALSICMNFSWELWVVINRLQNGSADTLGFFIQLTWLLLDMFIVATWFLFEKDASILKKLCTLLCIMLVVYLWAYRAGGWQASVFAINAIMSAEFIYRSNKDNCFYQSRFIAGAKMIGTFAATVLNGLFFCDMLVLWLGGLCFLMDLYYLIIRFGCDPKKG